MSTEPWWAHLLADRSASEPDSEKSYRVTFSADEVQMLICLTSRHERGLRVFRRLCGLFGRDGETIYSTYPTHPNYVTWWPEVHDVIDG